jgi:hypothetical protein
VCGRGEVTRERFHAATQAHTSGKGPPYGPTSSAGVGFAGDTLYWLHRSLKCDTAMSPSPTADSALRARHKMLGLFHLDRREHSRMGTTTGKSNSGKQDLVMMPSGPSAQPLAPPPPPIHPPQPIAPLLYACVVGARAPTPNDGWQGKQAVLLQALHQHT